MKKLALPLLVAIVLLIGTVYFFFSNTRGTIQTSIKDFTIADTASINKIFIVDKEGKSVTLQRQNSSNWTVNNKLARKDMIGFILEALKKMKVRSTVAESMKKTVIADLASTYQRKVEVYQNNKLAKVFYVGAASADNEGTYMLLEGSDEPFEMHIPGFIGFLRPRFSPIESDWVRRILFNFPSETIAKVDLKFNSKPIENFSIVSLGKDSCSLHNGNGIEIPKSQLDQSFVNGYIKGFSNIESDNDLNNPSLQDSLSKTIPNQTLIVTLKSGEVNTINCYLMKSVNPIERLKNGTTVNHPYNPDQFYVIYNNKLSVAQFYTFQGINVPLSFFYKGNK